MAFWERYNAEEIFQKKFIKKLKFLLKFYKK